MCYFTVFFFRQMYIHNMLLCHFMHMLICACVFFSSTHFLRSSTQAINLSAFCRISIIWPSAAKILPAGTWRKKGPEHSFWTPKGLTANTETNVNVTSWVLEI